MRSRAQVTAADEHILLPDALCCSTNPNGKPYSVSYGVPDLRSLELRQHDRQRTVSRDESATPRHLARAWSLRAVALGMMGVLWIVVFPYAHLRSNEMGVVPGRDVEWNGAWNHLGELSTIVDLSVLTLVGGSLFSLAYWFEARTRGSLVFLAIYLGSSFLICSGLFDLID